MASTSCKTMDDEAAGGKLVALQEHASAACAKQCKMWEKGSLCDVAVVVGKQSIRAHRFMLAAHSRYFHTLLFMSEDYSDSMAEDIELKELDSEAVKSIIKAMYKQERGFTLATVYLSGDWQGLLNIDDLVVDSAQVLIDAVLEWINHDAPGRQDALPGLLMAVRLALVPSDVLQKSIAEALVQKKRACLQLFNDALLYKQLPSCRAQLEAKHHWQPRPHHASKRYHLTSFPALAATQQSCNAESFDNGRWRLQFQAQTLLKSSYLAVYLAATSNGGLKVLTLEAKTYKRQAIEYSSHLLEERTFWTSLKAF
eukprot:jgi/Chlat1/8290/Chrsp78S09212